MPETPIAKYVIRSRCPLSPAEIAARIPTDGGEHWPHHPLPWTAEVVVDPNAPASGSLWLTNYDELYPDRGRPLTPDST